jgi:lipopolysaccharide/colanic/teichoic acid biosynthesis glycosyltransferase
MMILKFLFDRIVAFLGLIFLSPVMLVTAILVKVKMPGGPVFFVQKRVGQHGELFNCHKFRTMTVEHHGACVSVAGDSRITPLGAILRRYKIDELPGLWDVFIGKMSFVGPRPDVPGYADKLEGDDRDVLKMLPGITGPATLKYRNEEELIASFVRDVRSGSSALNRELIDVEFNKMTDEQVALWYNDNVIYPDKVRLNCYYYRNYSFIKDIQIIVVTVLKRKIRYADEII